MPEDFPTRLRGLREKQGKNRTVFFEKQMVFFRKQS